MKNKNQVKIYGDTTVFYLWDKETQSYFKGTSVCKPGDEYDEKFGIRLARTKAVYKMRMFKANRLNELLLHIEQLKTIEEKTLAEYKYWAGKAEESAKLLIEIGEGK